VVNFKKYSNNLVALWLRGKGLTGGKKRERRNERGKRKEKWELIF
jgi:hypothetical protein